MNPGNWIAIAAALIALYGAALSTFNFLHQRRKDTARLKVSMSHGHVVLGDGRLSDPMLLITMANVGHRVIRVTGPGLLLTNKRKLVSLNPTGDVRFPHDLLEGRECKIWTPLAHIEDQLRRQGLVGEVKLVPFCHDGTGTTHRGKPLTLLVGLPAPHEGR